MAIEARLIGRLGGSEVTSTPIDAQQTGQTWTTVWSMEVPVGETWLIAMFGTISNSSGLSPAGCRLVGEELTVAAGGGRPVKGTSRLEGPVTATLDIRASGGNATATLTGTVYTAPLD